MVWGQVKKKQLLSKTSSCAFVSRWTLLKKSLREVLERLGATDALALASLEDGAYDDFVKEGAPEEARGDFELLMREPHVKVRVKAQLAARPAEKLAMDLHRPEAPARGVNVAIQLESSVNGTMTVTW